MIDSGPPENTADGEEWILLRLCFVDPGFKEWVDGINSFLHKILLAFRLFYCPQDGVVPAPRVHALLKGCPYKSDIDEATLVFKPRPNGIPEDYFQSNLYPVDSDLGSFLIPWG